MNAETENQPKISLGLALVPMIVMGVLVGVLNLWMGIDLKFVLLLSSLVAGIVAYIVGVRVKQLIDDFGENVKKAFPAILILIAIGGIVGSWVYSGTVPYLIYLGLQVIHPSFLLVTAFIVTAVVSTLTGTSWGSAATAGVAFVGIGQSLGVPLEMVAGAVISGAVFGDKVSPVSDTTNICAMAVEINVYDHIKGMLPNVAIAGLLASLAFFALGMTISVEEGAGQNTSSLIAELEGIYNFNLFMLLPPVIVLFGGYKGYNPVLLMVSSSLLALVIGMISNGFSLESATASMVSGFNTEMVGASFEPSKTLQILLNRGGFEGMMKDAVLFCILAIGFGSFMESAGALKRIMKALVGGIRSTFGVVSTAFVAGATLNGVSGSAMFAILTIGQLFRGTFKERNIPLPVLSRSMENSMTLLESLLPWHVTAIFMAGTLEVDTLDYAPYAFFNIAGILLFLALVRVDIAKKKY